MSNRPVGREAAETASIRSHTGAVARMPAPRSAYTEDTISMTEIPPNTTTEASDQDYRTDPSAMVARVRALLTEQTHRATTIARIREISNELSELEQICADNQEASKDRSKADWDSRNTLGKVGLCVKTALLCPVICCFGVSACCCPSCFTKKSAQAGNSE